MPSLWQTLTGSACSSRMLIGGKPHAFVHTPQQLDCARSPTHVWKPEANQCGFASASSALDQSRPMIAEAGYVCVGISHHGSFSAHSHAPRTSCGTWLAAKNSFGQVASFVALSYTHEAKTLKPISVD
ncbi:hypothetical protein O181_091697 [Austropuccinia psidii MF-1]|uniref:Uncharacterized protein n=1 Tax=Austropuccinia psidii MF-1 TaxID=1389203 RepID=A0A9Q3IXR5_9BASI|nr:hypothetical protein [Austropuccinia psidii MF-1]